jgi:hypothetical protein
MRIHTKSEISPCYVSSAKGSVASGSVDVLNASIDDI